MFIARIREITSESRTRRTKWNDQFALRTISWRIRASSSVNCSLMLRCTKAQPKIQNNWIFRGKLVMLCVLCFYLYFTFWICLKSFHFINCPYFYTSSCLIKIVLLCWSSYFKHLEHDQELPSEFPSHFSQINFWLIILFFSQKISLTRSFNAF